MCEQCVKFREKLARMLLDFALNNPVEGHIRPAASVPPLQAFVAWLEVPYDTPEDRRLWAEFRQTIQSLSPADAGEFGEYVTALCDMMAVLSNEALDSILDRPHGTVPVSKPLREALRDRSAKRQMAALMAGLAPVVEGQQVH